MRCSVVIPCHDGAELTRACVASLLAQEGGFELEILLVDNASTDGTSALGSLDPRVHMLVQPSNRGYAGGVNAGLRAARHDTCLVLNNDTQAAPDLLLRLHEALARGPGIGLVAPVSNHVKGPARIAAGAAGRDAAGRSAIAAALRSAQAGVVQDVETLSGLCLLFRRTTLARLGPFDERFGPGNYEDDDLCLRARLCGLRLLIARDAFLHHEGHSTFRRLGLDYDAELRTRRAQFAAKWRQDPAGAAYLALGDGDLRQAAAAARIARRRHPDWPDADWILGRWHAARREPGPAAAHLRAFLDICPNHSQAALLLVEQEVRRGAGAAAQALLRDTLASCHVTAADLVALHRGLGALAMERNRPEQAEDSFRAALALDPEDGALHLQLGACLVRQGRHRDAVPVLEAAARRGQPLARTNLGICLLETGDAGRALHEFAEAARLLPDHPVAAANLALARRLAPAAVS